MYVVVIHVGEYECVEVYVCVASRKQKNINCSLTVWYGKRRDACK